MGKRQIGSMEPFELVITLIIAELACIPMADRNIPISYGIVAILTMFFIHQLILLLSKNMRLQSILSGKPVMVIDKQGICANSLKQLNMQVNDLLQAIRSAGYFSVEEIDYGLMETNGQLSVVPNKDTSKEPKTLPIPIILDGKWDDDDMRRYKVDKDKITSIIKSKKLKMKNILLLTADQKNRVIIHIKYKPFIALDYKEKLINE
ncbi:MAG: DUF421 domain-containing protein [Clostridia bacterium]